MRSHGGMPFHTRTDADGRYRVSGHAAARIYITAVYPPADSGYLAASDTEQTWPAGAKFLEKNFALEKGRIVHGQVVDADTKRPVVGAAVVYQPQPGNPNNRNYDLRNTVLTDTAGRFAITALPGQGFLAVETPDESYIRTPIAGRNGSRIDLPSRSRDNRRSPERGTEAGRDRRSEGSHARSKSDRPRRQGRLRPRRLLRGNRRQVDQRLEPGATFRRRDFSTSRRRPGADVSRLSPSARSTNRGRRRPQTRFPGQATGRGQA